MPDDIKDEIFRFRYRERFRLSVEQMDREPWEALYQAQLIWSIDAERDNLERERQQLNSA